MADAKPDANHVKCKFSASLLNNNLSTNGSYLTLVHKSEVQVMKNSTTLLTSDKSAAASQTCRTAYCEKDAVSQSRFVKIGSNDHLVVVTFSGQIHLLDTAGQKSLSSTRLGKYPDSKSLSGKDCLLRGIASDGTDLYLGSGGGGVLVCAASDAAVQLKRTIPGHKAGVSDLAVEGSVLASGDDSGCVLLRNLSDGKVLGEFKGAGYPVTSIAMGHGHCVASYSSGHIRMFDLASKAMVCEIAAHTRTITGITIHPTKAMVAACSEDSFLSCWSLPTAANPQGVRNLLSVSINPALLTGVIFCGKERQLLAVTSFDSRFISAIPIPTL